MGPLILMSYTSWSYDCFISSLNGGKCTNFTGTWYLLFFTDVKRHVTGSVNYANRFLSIVISHREPLVIRVLQMASTEGFLENRTHLHFWLNKFDDENGRVAWANQWHIYSYKWQNLVGKGIWFPSWMLIWLRTSYPSGRRSSKFPSRPTFHICRLDQTWA